MAVRLYCDASVFAALVLGDSTAEAIGDCLDPAGAERLYSDLGWGEMVAAVSRQVRMGALAAAAGTQAVDRARLLLQDWTDVGTLSADIVQAALWLCDFKIALKLPDAIHIAIASRIGATLVSADRQQVAAARSLHVVCINPLEEPA